MGPTFSKSYTNSQFNVHIFTAMYNLSKRQTEKDSDWDDGLYTSQRICWDSPPTSFSKCNSGISLLFENVNKLDGQFLPSLQNALKTTNQRNAA